MVGLSVIKLKPTTSQQKNISTNRNGRHRTRSSGHHALAAAANLQLGLKGAQRPLYITTTSPYLRTEETSYAWQGLEPIICIRLADNQLTPAQLGMVSSLSEENA